MLESSRTTVHEAVFGHRRLTIIEPSRGWRALDLKELWAYRELLWVLAQRDIRVRYKQTVLGAAWAIARPVLTMLIFTAVFGRMARFPSDGYPYSVFVYAGLLPWTFFAAALQTAGNSLVSSAHLISKVYFPRLIIPTASIGAAFVDLLVSMSILFVLLLYHGIPLGPRLAALPLLLVALLFTTLGIGTLIAALTVTYRDLIHLLPFVVQIWLFVTPVIYPSSMIPERWRWVLQLNPMASLVEGFRAAFLGRPFDLPALATCAAVAGVVFLFAVAFFERVERRFADVI